MYMRNGFMAVLAAVLSACVFSCLITACDGKNGATGPAGQSVTIMVTPTPSLASHSFLGSWGSNGSAPGQFSDLRDIAVDGAGNIYVGDSGNNRVQEIPLVGNTFVTWGGTGTGTAAGQFNYPMGVALDALGDLWVADLNNNRLQEYSPGSSTWQTIGGTASGTLPGQFFNPNFLAFDRAGNLYVSDFLNNRIQELPAGLAATVASNWATFGAAGANPGEFNGPSELALDNSGDLFVADQGNNRVQELPAGKDPNTPANWITIGASGINPGQFAYPTGVAVDGSGNLFVSDGNNNRIQELPAGLAATVSGNWVVFGSYGTNPGQFENPAGIALDASGNLYVADDTNDRIQKFSP